MNEYCIYMLTSPSGKSYIGQTKQIETRLYTHRYPKKNTKLVIGKAINKYGFDNFKINILHDKLNSDQADELEKFSIEHYKTLFPYGYNKSTGGKAQNPTKDTRILISEKAKGRGFSDEHRKNLSEAAKKRKYSPELRKILSESHKGAKLSESHKKNISLSLVGRPCSEETRQKISIGNKRRFIKE